MAPKQSVITSYQKIKLKEIEWLANASETWEIAACWHIPNAMKRYYCRFDERWLSTQINRYFKNVDRRIFKTAHKKHNMRLQRIITLEKADKVGWHAHGLIKNAPNLSNYKTAEILKDEWLKHTKKFAQAYFEKHQIYLAPDYGSYLGYMTKNIDWLNEKALATLDTNNTFLQ